MAAVYAPSPQAAFVDSATIPGSLRPGDILVFGNHACGDCINALQANNNVIQTENGTRVIWVNWRDLTDEQAAAMGLRWDTYNPPIRNTDGSLRLGSDGRPLRTLYYADGTQINGTPTATRIGTDGRPGHPIAEGEALARAGAFERLSQGAQASLTPEVQQQALAAINTPGGGSGDTPPYAATTDTTRGRMA